MMWKATTIFLVIVILAMIFVIGSQSNDILDLRLSVASLRSSCTGEDVAERIEVGFADLETHTDARIKNLTMQVDAQNMKILVLTNEVTYHCAKSATQFSKIDEHIELVREGFKAIHKIFKLQHQIMEDDNGNR